MNYAVIMAGGAGKRLWPLSRKNRPKQILKIIEGKTLLRKCCDRLLGLFDARNIIVLTNIDYVDPVREDLPELPPDNVIAEPTARDTAGAIGLAATILSKINPQATMAIVTADHLIEPPQALQQVLKDALTFVNNNPDALVTFGIKPTYPATQLGYIKCSSPQRYPDCKNDIYTVQAFREKPDPDTSVKYLEDPNYFWNSGMFVWKVKTILENLERFLPESTEPLKKIKNDWDSPAQQKSLRQWFPKMPKISIDFAVMEKAEKVYAIKLECNWLDMGSLIALADIISSDKDRNVVVAETAELLDCKNSIIVTEDHEHLIAGIGLENIVVAHTPDATLVCSANQTHRLKELLEIIEKNKGQKFL